MFTYKFGYSIRQGPLAKMKVFPASKDRPLETDELLTNKPELIKTQHTSVTVV